MFNEILSFGYSVLVLVLTAAITAPAFQLVCCVETLTIVKLPARYLRDGFLQVAIPSQSFPHTSDSTIGR